MHEPVIHPHPLRGAIIGAIREARQNGHSSAIAFALACRAVMDASPGMGVVEAFELVNKLWVCRAGE